MFQSFLAWFILAVAFFSISNSVLLNRAQLKIWYPSFETESSFDLSYKQITLISNDAFTNLTNLNNDLYLSVNQISTLGPLTFRSLINLKNLFLWGNQLVGEIDPTTFSYMTNLQSLIRDHCYCLYIHH